MRRRSISGRISGFKYSMHPNSRPTHQGECCNRFQFGANFHLQAGRPRGVVVWLQRAGDAASGVTPAAQVVRVARLAYGRSLANY